MLPSKTPEGFEPMFVVSEFVGKNPDTGEVDCQLKFNGY
jgi:hypothetical protein